MLYDSYRQSFAQRFKVLTASPAFYHDCFTESSLHFPTSSPNIILWLYWCLVRKKLIPMHFTQGRIFPSTLYATPCNCYFIKFWNILQGCVYNKLYDIYYVLLFLPKLLTTLFLFSVYQYMNIKTSESLQLV